MPGIRRHRDPATAHREIALDQMLQLLGRNKAPTPLDVVEQFQEDVVIRKELLAVRLEPLIVLLASEDDVGDEIAPLLELRVGEPPGESVSLECGETDLNVAEDRLEITNRRLEDP